ncbi:efflux RND transporter periplasmic adaptor subunit [Desulfocurvus vexinensis]|uniref:efflux RND transporter periplasmic adaptor subunit n=1 Tax=Desulfocurvus vexinensis TaxID=399548 RepID=UPI00048EE9D2|nr:efflux RND transporter periplasmic adaptor subunit [Desulfocurvus vexinensis]
MRSTTTLLLTVWALAAGLLAGCSGQPEEQAAAQPRAVSLARAERLGDGPGRGYPGAVRAARQAELALRVGGPLVAVHVAPGDTVRKGQPLLRIDPRDFEDAIRTLEAQLAGARAAQRNAGLNLGRTGPLLASGAVAQADYDNAQSAHDTARAQAQALEAQLAAARHALDDTVLRAPFDGLVTARHVENHEMVAAGQLALALRDIAELEIDTDVPETDMARMAPGRTPGASGAPAAQVEFLARPGQHHPARLKEWSAEPDPATRAYRVTFALPAPQGLAILPGMTCQVLLPTGPSAPGALSVPASALGAAGPKAGRSAVWVFDPQTATATRREVRTGQLVQGSRVEVLDGLAEGEPVVAAGVDFITEGMALRPLGDAGAEQAQ